MEATETPRDDFLDMVWEWIRYKARRGIYVNLYSIKAGKISP
jgi:hypothetical protein